MRDYALQQAISFEQVGAPKLVALWRNWKARRAVARLAAFDDVMLDDIGVTRADIAWAMRLPLNENAALALESQCLRHRRRLRR